LQAGVLGWSHERDATTARAPIERPNVVYSRARRRSRASHR
jgi:hypothetical protein